VRLSLGLFAIVLALGAAACSAPSPSVPTPPPAVAPPQTAAQPVASSAAGSPVVPSPVAAASGGQLQRVRIAQSIPALSFAALMIARDLKYFEAAGLELQFTELQSGATAQQALIGGSVDLTDSASTEIAAGVANGLPLIAIQNTAMQTLEVCVRKDLLEKAGVTTSSPIQARMAALKGATIGITGPGAVSDRAMRWLLSKYGSLDPNTDTTLVAISAGSMSTALEQNRVQAFLLSPPNCEVINPAIGLVLLKPTEVPEFKNYVHEVLYTSKDWVAKHPDLATRAATALSRGNNYVIQHPAEAIALLQKDFASVPPQIIEQSMREVILPQIPKDGKMTEAMWTATNTVLYESGLIKQPLDIKEGALWTNQYIGDASVP
jgi:ABC-type nitrate/sulfonate/bicarbonate transport system substrate-binding protein